MVCNICAVDLNVCLSLRKLGDQGGFTTFVLMRHISVRLDLQSIRQQNLRRNFTINSTLSKGRWMKMNEDEWSIFWFSNLYDLDEPDLMCDPEVEWWLGEVPSTVGTATCLQECKAKWDAPAVDGLHCWGEPIRPIRWKFPQVGTAHRICYVWFCKFQGSPREILGCW